MPHCRSCGSEGLTVFLQLGSLPLPDGFRRADELDGREDRFPLDVAVCEDCSLVQILFEVSPRTLFVDNYLYFSSFSDELVARSAQFARATASELRLGPDSLVVEVASNDGYLLRSFAAQGIPVLGIDPAPAQAAAAEKAGVPTLTEFFGLELARRLAADGRGADLIVANNVMAHTPDLNDFVAGLSVLLGDGGVATIENTYVRDLIDNLAFDTIYHEHFCYFSCTAVAELMRRHGLRLLRIEHLPTVQGGSLRWRVGRRGEADDSVERYLREEAACGLTGSGYFRDFARRVELTRRDLLALLVGLRADGRSIAAYGAAAKGTILLNAVGIDRSIVDYVVDRNVHKHGLFMPGVDIPICDPSRLLEDTPDYLLLLAWNYKREIMSQQAEYRARGGRFIVPVPTPEVV